MERAKISIIIPCYNDPDFLKESVESAIKQSYRNKEIILIDDGSDEQTKAEIERLKPQLDLVITQKNKGVSTARNTGIREASGEFILVLDSDDYFEPTFCEKAIAVLEEDKTIKVVTCYARWFTTESSYKIFKPTGGELSNYLFSNVTLSNSMFRKKEWLEVGGYDEKILKGFEDWEFYIRIHENGGRTLVIPEVLFHYRRREASKTTIANQNKYELLKYIYTKHEKLYKDHFPLLIDHFLKKIKREEKEKIKNLNRIEFIIGKSLLQPLRWLKKKFNRYPS